MCSDVAGVSGNAAESEDPIQTSKRARARVVVYSVKYIITMAITVEVFCGDGALPIRLPTSSSLAKCSNTQLVHQLVDRLHRLMILFVKYERIGAGQRSS